MKTKKQKLFTRQKNFFSSAKTVRTTLSVICFFLTVMLTNAQECKLYSGCNMVLNGSVNVVFNNIALKNDGTFTAGTSTVSFTGNADTTVSYLSGANNTQFYNLTFNKSAYGTALKSSAGVKNILTLSAGTLYADSNLTLLSDALNTARLASVAAGAAVTGKAMVERYIPAKRAWRLMTAPVTNSSSIYNTWQNKGVYTVGRGLLVSGPGASNGLDNGNAASMKTWDVSSQSLLPVTNTYVSISPTNTGTADNIGYFVFVRGDRNTNNFIIPNTNATTLTSTGALQTGNQTFTASSGAGKYTLIGNPYASPIDFNAVSRTNLVKRFYVWDPTINTLGGYVTLDDLDNDGVYSKSVAGSAQTKEIQSSQAFFVETNSNGAASVTISEASKSTTNNLAVFRPASLPVNGNLRINLYLLNNDNSTVLADGVLTEYNDRFNAGITNEDALKFININENLGILHDGVTLAIERRPLVNADDTIFLKLTKTTQRRYQLNISPANIDGTGLTASLEDNYLKTSFPISLSNENAVNFSVDANAASAAPGRFRIVFKPYTVLAVAFQSVNVYKAGENAQLQWTMADQTNVVSYEVERSSDGIHFTTAGYSDKNTLGNYYWTDAIAAGDNFFYRIKSINRDGSKDYSRIVKLTIGKTLNGFTIEQNPVKGNTIQLHVENQPAGVYQFNLFNSVGQLVYQSKQQVNMGITSLQLKMNDNLVPGTYQLQITGAGNTNVSQKIIVTQ